MRALSKYSTLFRARRLGALAAASALLAGALAMATSARDAEGAPGDNVIFILTDDQSATELAAMPNTQALIGGQGMTFTRAYIPYPLCCPSRASMLTGEYMHNHGVRGNAGPFGAGSGCGRTSRTPSPPTSRTTATTTSTSAST